MYRVDITNEMHEFKSNYAPVFGADIASVSAMALMGMHLNRCEDEET